MEKLDLIDKYLNHLRFDKGRAERTILEYRSILKVIDLDFLNAKDYHTVDQSIRKLAEAREWGTYTKWRAAEVVKLFYKWLFREKIILENPYPYHEFEKGRRQPPQFYDKESDKDTVRKILYHPLNSIRDTCILHLVHSTGFRPMEIAKLNMGDVDVKNRFIRVRDSKRGSYRDVPISEIAAAWTEMYLKSLIATLPEQPLFFTVRGRRFRAGGISKLFMRIAIRTGQDLYAYMFRHGVGADLINKGADISIVADILGHESISTTKKYIHFKREKLREHFDRFSASA